MFTVVLYYKYTDIFDPEKLRQEQRLLCEKLQLKGRMIIAKEGINATFEGKTADIDRYIQTLSETAAFADIDFKKSTGTGKAFPKLSIKVRTEIVSGHLGKADINPTRVTGKYITAETLHEWIMEATNPPSPKGFGRAREFYIVDMRNDYEQSVGVFENSLVSGMHNFKDLPDVLPKLAHLKGKTIVTVCTGGVRCEKASGFLVENGFKDVYQLYGGIVTYMEKYPNEHFQGSLYVFDNRIIMGFNRDDPKRKIIGKCVMCQNLSEHFINCKDSFCDRHFICCASCLKGQEKILCPMGCRDYSQEHPETQKTKHFVVS